MVKNDSWNMKNEKVKNEKWQIEVFPIILLQKTVKNVYFTNQNKMYVTKYKQ